MSARYVGAQVRELDWEMPWNERERKTQEREREPEREPEGLSEFVRDRGDGSSVLRQTNRPPVSGSGSAGRQETENGQSDGKEIASVIQRREQAVIRQEEAVGRLEECLAQMGRMLAAMQRRIEDMEAREQAVTVPHSEVKVIMARIRFRSGEIVEKYGLQKADVKIFRSAIRKEMLKKYGIRDLHDLPASEIGAAERWIDGWNSMRLVMECRDRAERE